MARAETATRVLEVNLRADAAIGEDFEDEGMRQAAVDEVDLADASAEGVEGAVHLRDHATADDFFGLQFGDAGLVEARNEGAVVFGIAHHTTHIAEEDEFRGLEALREGTGGEIGVHVEGFAAGKLAGDG